MGISKTSVLVLALASLALAYPASDDKEIDHDVEIIPLEKRRPDLPAYFDEDAFDPEEVGFFPFSFTQSLADFMNRWIKDVSEMFGSIPTKNVSSFGHFPGIPNLGDIDLSKGNTTSVVKIIDGHKVEINETVFRKDLANGGSYYKVKLINVLPDEQPEAGSERPEVAASSTPRDVETVENSRENEIPPLEVTDNSPQKIQKA